MSPSATAALALLMAMPTSTADSLQPLELAQRLDALGSRRPTGSGYQAAQTLLLESLRAAGLDEVSRLDSEVAGDWTHLTALSRGADDSRIEVSAHYDTAAVSSGLLDNACGCAVAIVAAADLARTPRHHDLQLVLTDAEESGSRGSREWLAQRTSADLDQTLANLNLDVLGSVSEGPGVLHLVRRRDRGGLALTPAWLVETAMDAATRVGLPLACLDRRWSLFAQLAVRLGRPRRISDAESYLAAGVAALTLSDLSLSSVEPPADVEPGAPPPERLEEWSRLVAAVVRGLDAVTESPVDDTEYLVLGSRLVDRRGLLWVGFLLWVALVWSGLPGAWRRTSANRRRRRGRVYMPGFAFRMVFLLASFLMPAIASLLLYPAALCALVGVWLGSRARQVLAIAGAAPALAFGLWLALALRRGWIVLDSTSILPAALLTLTLAIFCTWMLDPARDANGPCEFRAPVS